MQIAHALTIAGQDQACHGGSAADRARHMLGRAAIGHRGGARSARTLQRERSPEEGRDCRRHRIKTALGQRLGGAKARLRREAAQRRKMRGHGGGNILRKPLNQPLSQPLRQPVKQGTPMPLLRDGSGVYRARSAGLGKKRRLHLGHAGRQAQVIGKVVPFGQRAQRAARRL